MPRVVCQLIFPRGPEDWTSLIAAFGVDKFVKARSLQCGFWPRSSQILIWIMHWILQWILCDCFFEGKRPEQIYQKIPRDFVRKNPPRISAETFSWKFERLTVDWNLRSSKFLYIRRAPQIITRARKKPININVFGGTVSGTNRNRPWDKWDPSPGQNGTRPWDKPAFLCLSPQ